jgi:DNA polymerase-3 subunit alpha
MGFPGYFLIVADFIKWAKESGHSGRPGRGSGAGSLVAWVLTITDVDPLRFGLLFERFLNPERVSMPDFDIDFCQERREEVISYVQEKYGRDSVAQIITFGSLAGPRRAARRRPGDAAAAGPGRQDLQDGAQQPGRAGDPGEGHRHRAASQAGPRRGRQRQGLLDVALQLEGLFRNASTHAAGVVIGDRPLTQLTPLYKDPRSDLPATQFNMKWVESAGLVKFDFLGLKTLTVLDRAVKHLAKRGEIVDLAATAVRRHQDLRTARLGPDGRRVPAGKPGHARHPAQDALRLDRGDHRADLAVPPGPDG